MPRPPKKPAKPEDLPVLTELSDSSLDIPVLTEAVVEEMQRYAAPQPALTEEQCRQLAAQIAPQLEAMLRDRLLAHFGVMWQASWREVENKLPELIRDQLARREHHAQ